MKVNEVKVTREVVVRTEYVAEDGTTFISEEECKKYEASALATVSRKLKRLTGDLSEFSIFDCGNEDNLVEVFDIQTQEDLDNLEKYLRLKCHDESCFSSENGMRKNWVFEGVTYGHEVMIFWDYEEDYFWVYKDGSIQGLLDFLKEKLVDNIYPKEEKKDENGN